MKYLIAILILLSALSSSATTYCVSNAGSDSNSGIATGPNCTGAVSAWQTIGHVNAQTFKPGDQILFHDGGVWREVLTPPSSGKIGNPITFGSYGTGNKPIISGSDLVTGFSTLITNVHPASVATRPNEIWINGTSLGPPVASEAALVSQNQWFWSGGTLFIRSSANPFSGQTVEAANRTNAAYVSVVNYVTLNGLELTNTNGAAVYIRQDTYDTLQDMSIHDAYNQGVYLGISGGGHIIENCEIYNTGFNQTLGAGSAIQTDTTLTVPSIFQNNYIYNVGFGSARGDHGIYDQSPGDISRFNTFRNFYSSGIKIDANGAQIYGNVFNTIAQNGVYVDAYSNIRVINNSFYDVGTVSPYGAIVFNGDGAESGVEFKNNIFEVSGGPYAFAIVVNTNSAGFTSDYNDVYGTNVAYGEWSDGNTYGSLASWTSATGQDKHSITKDPQFVNLSGTNFSLDVTSPARNAGLPIADYAFPYYSPDLGAIPYYAKAANTLTF